MYLIKQFLNEHNIEYKDLGKNYFLDDDKYHTVYKILFCNNYGFRKLHYFMMNYKMGGVNRDIELIYKDNLLYLKFR